MNIQFHIRGLQDNAALRHRLQQPLERLETHIPINAAAVVVEHDGNNAPGFRGFVLLAVPGPDIHAEARDHTLEAAWLKVTAALRRQIEQRKARQDARTKTNGHVRAQASQRTTSATGWRPRVSGH